MALADFKTIKCKAFRMSAIVSVNQINRIDIECYGILFGNTVYFKIIR